MKPYNYLLIGTRPLTVLIKHVDRNGHLRELQAEARVHPDGVRGDLMHNGCHSHTSYRYHQDQIADTG